MKTVLQSYLTAAVLFSLLAGLQAQTNWQKRATNSWGGKMYVASIGANFLRYESDAKRWKGDVISFEQAAALAPEGALLYLVEEIPPTREYRYLLPPSRQFGTVLATRDSLNLYDTRQPQIPKPVKGLFRCVRQLKKTPD